MPNVCFGCTVSWSSFRINLEIGESRECCASSRRVGGRSLETRACCRVDGQFNLRKAPAKLISYSLSSEILPHACLSNIRRRNYFANNNTAPPPAESCWRTSQARARVATLMPAFARANGIEGISAKSEGGKRRREERFPWEIESTASVRSLADEKVVRERLHNRRSPAAFTRRRRATRRKRKNPREKTRCCVGSRSIAATAVVVAGSSRSSSSGSSGGLVIYDDGACCSGQLSGPCDRKTRSVIYRGDKGIGEEGRLPIEEPAIRERFNVVICLFKFSATPPGFSHRASRLSPRSVLPPAVTLLLQA